MASERAERLHAPPFIDPPGYARHRPEATLLYQLVERYYPEFVATREAAGRPLPRYVQEEFEAYLKCGRFEHGFLRVRCEDCRAGTVENPTPRHVAMTWARRLQRVVGIEIERCARCGGRLRVIASIEEPALIARILAHRRERGAEDPPVASLGPRAPPPALLF